MDLCWHGNVFAFLYVVKFCHSFPSKEQVSSNLMAALILERRKIKFVTVSSFPLLFAIR